MQDLDFLWRTSFPVPLKGVRHTLIAGSAFDLKSPVETYSRLFYVRSQLSLGSSLEFFSDGQEVAFYVIDGTVSVEGQTYSGPGLLHFYKGASIEILAITEAHGLLLGGDSFPEPRRIWWNFVSSSQERIERAKKDWRQQAFPKSQVKTEFFPLLRAE